MNSSKPKILVTGSAGLLGSAVCDLLDQAQLPFQTLDLNPNGHSAGLNHFVGAATDPQLVQAAIKDMQAVIHLAAIRNPNYGSSIEVFNNALATFTVLDAAASNGINRAMIASSFSATGLPFANVKIQLAELPIDESFENQISDTYALSKNIDELTAKYMNTRFGMRTIAIRYPYIGDHLELLPARFAQIKQDPKVGCKELWTYIDIRDAAQIALAVILDEELLAGSYFVSAANVLGPFTAAELVEQHCADATLKTGHGKFDSLVDYSHAKAGLKFLPRYNYPNE